MPRDLHSALQTEVLEKQTAGGVEFTLVKLRDGKEDVRHSLHAYSSTWTSAGVQTTDGLQILEFVHYRCPWSHDDGYCTQVDGQIELSEFADAFAEYVEALREAERHLTACGIFHPALAGGNRYSRVSDATRGDGHRSPNSKEMKASEDDNFRYVFSWIEGGEDKGWVTHYGLKHEPISAELQAAFDFLGLNDLAECPWFDFERCYWRFTQFENKPSGSFFDSNADVAHRWFDSHAEHFSLGLQKLIEAHTAVEPFGFVLLPRMGRPQDRLNHDIKARTVEPSTQATDSPTLEGLEFDVAISFAGSDRALAEELAEIVRTAGYRVFYDNFYPEMLWGKDLPVFFDEIYRKRSRFCVIFVSAEYLQRMWTNHERESAVARQMKERTEYILPIQVDDSELPGVAPTVGHMNMKDRTVKEIAELLIEKLRAA